jgi:predicted ATP-dependent protease
VVLQAQNVKELVLRPEVVEAIQQGRFNLYPIRTVDEGIEILTGVKAGSIEEPGTVHYLVLERLRALAEGLRRFEARGDKEKKQDEQGPNPQGSVAP